MFPQSYLARRVPWARGPKRVSPPRSRSLRLKRCGASPAAPGAEVLLSGAARLRLSQRPAAARWAPGSRRERLWAEPRPPWHFKGEAWTLFKRKRREKLRPLVLCRRLGEGAPALQRSLCKTEKQKPDPQTMKLPSALCSVPIQTCPLKLGMRLGDWFVMSAGCNQARERRGKKAMKYKLLSLS